jgi:hypothetical protein
MDRQIIHLAFHARLARIFRPFLLVPVQPLPGRNIDPRCSHFRSLCLRSARSVLGIASTLLRESLEESAARLKPLPLMHRSGCVISHMFLACVVLATDPILAHSKGGEVSNPDVETIHVELAHARRLLESVGEKSPMAASLVRKLIGVLRKHNVHAAAPTAGREPEEQPGSDTTAGSFVSDAATSECLLSGNSNTTSYTDGTASGTQIGPTKQQPLPPYYESPHTVDGSAHAVIDASWVVGNGGIYQTQSLDGMGWPDLTDAGFTDANSWGQLFADLDAAFPASI